LITGFATDHREVAPGDAFLAIRGSRVDGHDFVPDAIARGAALAITERAVEATHIRVPALVPALAEMASTFRFDYRGPVVGITGSAGKTTTKEFVASALGHLGPIQKTLGNRNTEYTAPLLWPEVRHGHAAVVVEMSMRGKGQIHQLATFCRPTHSIVTNIGWSHLEQVGSREAIAQAKSEILEALPEDGVAILWREDEYYESLRRVAWPRQIFTFGFTSEADCRIIEYEPIAWDRCRLKGFYINLPWEAELPIVGRHVALNAAAAIAAAACLGVSPMEAAQSLAFADIPPFRMDVRVIEDVIVVLDTYNAAPPSMIGAIETVSELPSAGRRYGVIGEMRELGQYTEVAHREIGRKLAESRIESVCFIGEPMVTFAAEEFAASGKSMVRANSLADVRAYRAQFSAGDTVLVKGSRALELERAFIDAEA
jgi:UDP-N-acetylmuramoyl-tripeptide--D-alanyl-D-alanine ligase